MARRLAVAPTAEAAQAEAPSGPPPAPRTRPILGFVALLLLVEGGLLWSFGGGSDQHAVAGGALPVLLALLVGAEYFMVRFRIGEHTEGLNLVEAVLAPMLFAFPTPAVAATAAVSQVLGGVLRRNEPVKVAFNVAQWSLAATVGSLLMHSLAPDPVVGPRGIAALVAALLSVGLLNWVLFSAVLVLAGVARGRRTAGGNVIVVTWVGGLLANALIGLLFVFAFSQDPVAVVLFPVPLAILHIAYRGYAAARSDRARLAGLQRAAAALSEPLDPREAVHEFLREVGGSFEARGVVLGLQDGQGTWEVHEIVEDVVGTSWRPEEMVPLLSGVAAIGHPVRLTTKDARLGHFLAADGWRHCLAAPIQDGAEVVGVLAILDQVGLEGLVSGELAVLDALARETAGAFAKGRLLTSVLEERRKLAEIVGTTSDGIVAIRHDGTIASWNPAMESLTGIRAAEALADASVLDRLRLRSADGRGVNLLHWYGGQALPAELYVDDATGKLLQLACSYSQATDEAGQARTLVVVARDVTSAQEMQALRAQLEVLEVEQAAQREAVEQLQQAVVPAQISVTSTDLAVAYVASDPSAPTGGDLFDWQLLQDGSLHLAVIDVLGHGVGATKDALSVVHSLRVAAVDGTPLDQLLERTAGLVEAQNPNLVATALVVRYDPVTGRAQVVSGGHPPAIVVSAAGEATTVEAHGGVIGWPGAGSDDVIDLQLGVGDTLVIYTDGLVEARKNIVDGIDELIAHARMVAHLPAQELAQGLVDRALAGAERRDDTLALVLRRTGDREAPTTGWYFPPAPESVSTSRQRARTWLREQGVAESSIDDLALVISELLSNAVRVARAQVALSLVLAGDDVRVHVSDDGRGDPRLPGRGLIAPSQHEESGRGLVLVRAVARDFSISTSSAGTAVRCTVPITRSDAPARRATDRAAGQVDRAPVPVA